MLSADERVYRIYLSNFIKNNWLSREKKWYIFKCIYLTMYYSSFFFCCKGTKKHENKYLRQINYIL